VEREAAGAMLGDAKHMMTSREVCCAVGNPDAAGAFRAPIRSNVPTLFINRTLDPNMLVWQVEKTDDRKQHASEYLV